MGLATRSLRLRSTGLRVAQETRPSLRQDLVLAVTPQTGSAIVNPVDGAFGAFNGSTAWVGPYLNLPSAGAFVNWGTTKAPLLANLALGPFSLVTRVFLRTGANGGVAERSDGNTVNAGWMIGISESSRFGLILIRTTTNLVVFCNTTTFNKWMTLGVCYPGTLTAAGVNLYLDGVKQPLSSTADGAGVQGSDLARDFWLGKCSFTNAICSAASLNCLVDYTYIWRRFLRSEEVRAVTADPSAVYRPGVIPIGLPGAAPPPTQTFPALTLAP
jgi:hypothetical protein